MEVKNFIDQAFEKYEKSPELIDFKEELLTNLEDRLNSLQAAGMSRTKALREIEVEFADINKIADEMSLAKKKEVFELQYMSLRHFVTKTQAAIYTALGVAVLFGLVTAGLSYLSTTKIESLLGVLLVFLAVPIAGFVYMGLMQETARRNSMRPLRAAIYAVASLLLLISVLLVLMTVFGEAKSLVGGLGILIPFALPGVGLIAFLLLTEADYRKPWVVKETEKHNEWAQKFEHSGNAMTFGLLTGAIWILTIGAVILLLILKQWLYSWLPLVAALAATLILLAYYMRKDSEKIA